MQRGVTGASAGVAPPCARASCALPRGRARSPCTAPCGRLSAAQDHAHARNCTYAHARTRTHCDCIGGLCIARKREDTVRTKRGTPHDMARAIDTATSDGARSQAQSQSRCRCGGEPSPGADVGVSPVPVPMWGRAQSRCRCGRGQVHLRLLSRCGWIGPCDVTNAAYKHTSKPHAPDESRFKRRCMPDCRKTPRSTL